MNQNIGKKKIDSATLITAGIVLALYALVFALEQVLPATSMFFAIMQKVAVYALVAVSMNLLNGFTGIFSLGQAGFMLVGAYVYAIFTMPNEARQGTEEVLGVYYKYGGSVIQFTVPWVVGLVMAGCVAALFAFLIGLPVLRLKSDYLAIATLGFAEIVRALFQWEKLGPVTNGANQLTRFPNFFDFNIRNADGQVTVYMDTLMPMLIAGVCIGIILLLINSTYGRALRAMKDDEVAAEAMGVGLAHHKRLAFCISSFFAGVGGAMLAMMQSSVQAKGFTTVMTYEILLIVVIGGIGSVTGSCLSSFLFVASSEWWLRFLDQEHYLDGEKLPLMRNGFRLLVFSIIIMVVVLFFRKGIMGTRELPDVIRSMQGRKARKSKGGVAE